MNPLYWLPVTVVIMYFSMWISHLSNQNPTEIKWFLINWLMLCCTPIWSVIAVYSKDLVFDAMLFDITIVISCTMFSMYFTGRYLTVNMYEILGIIVIIIGFFLFKLGDIKMGLIK